MGFDCKFTTDDLPIFDTLQNMISFAYLDMLNMDFEAFRTPFLLFSETTGAFWGSELMESHRKNQIGMEKKRDLPENVRCNSRPRWRHGRRRRKQVEHGWG